MNAGFYGKMPCKGDFVGRGLPRALIDRLDLWLQQGMVQSRERLGEGWLDHYLVSPIWYGYFAAGVVDERPWIGAMVPSIDRVGRYFPCLILLPLAAELPHLAALEAQRPVLAQAGELLLDSLEDGFDFDRFCERVSQLQAIPVAGPAAVPAPLPDLAAPRMRNLYPQRDRWQGARLPDLLGSPCVWFSEGSTTIAPQLLLSEGLPSPSHFAQLLTGEPPSNPD